MIKNEKVKKVAQWVLMLAVILGVTVSAPYVAQARAPHQQSVTVFVSPHPDDEFQMWSLVEQRPLEYKIFVTLTFGEESGFCDPDTAGEALQEDLGEVSPQPFPEGKWTRSCEEARAEALLGFLEQMSKADPTIPGSFGAPETFEMTVPDGVSICRTDDGVEICGADQRRVTIWHDSEDRGAVVFFNLGDGDVTVEETQAAISATLQSREEWRLAPELPVGALVGAFANAGTRCYSYPHPDHLVVETTLWNVDFASGPQLGATCFVGRRQDMSAFVSAENSQAGFELGDDRTRIGAHARHYGWLHHDVYPLATSQANLFHRMQSFWVRFN